MPDTSPPRITIVTPSFNQARYLPETIASVLSQDYPNLEYIIVDGASTDGSREIIKKHERHLACWISEKDSGQSEAINKGLARSSGDLATWLNSDDILLPGALNAVAEAYHGHPDADWFVANCCMMDRTGHIARATRGEGWHSVLPRLGILHIYGPSAFFTRRLWEAAGGLDPSFHYLLDVELWWRFYSTGARFVRMDRHLWAFRLHEESKTSGHEFRTSPLASPQHPCWAQKRKEEEMLRDRYGLEMKKPRYLLGLTVSRALRLLTLRYPRSQLETLRWKGRHWSECFVAESRRDTRVRTGPPSQAYVP